MAKQILSKDWSETSLGALSCWPDEAKSAVMTCLNTPFACAVHFIPKCVNPETINAHLIILFNDAYLQAIVSQKQALLGQHTATVCSEMWPQIRSQYDNILQGSPPVSIKDCLLVIDEWNPEKKAYVRKERFHTYRSHQDH